MRVVFMGTPEFAVPSLKALLDAGYGVVGVFTQPDRPVGRGHKLAACPVKKLAVERGVPVYQFERLRNEEGLACLRALAPDIVVTAAFGQILSQALLDVPKMGTVNVHASLLPAYRGAAPINWCIMMGEKVSGVTTMYTDLGLDTGDYSFGYIAGWSSGKEQRELRASLDCIRSTAAELISGIERQCLDHPSPEPAFKHQRRRTSQSVPKLQTR